MSQYPQALNADLQPIADRLTVGMSGKTANFIKNSYLTMQQEKQ